MARDSYTDALDLALAIESSTIRVLGGPVVGQWQLADEGKAMIVAALRAYMRPPGPSERLIIALESCSSKLAQLGREFSSVRFTDRHGDGPVCLALAKHARTVLDEVRLGATTSPIEKEKPCS